MPSRMLPVSTFNAGLAAIPGLRIGDSGFPRLAGASVLVTSDASDEPVYSICSGCIYEGPVTQDIRASPNGPDRQLVPGALLDLSWPKASVEVLRRGGRPGIVATGSKQTNKTSN